MIFVTSVAFVSINRFMILSILAMIFAAWVPEVVSSGQRATSIQSLTKRIARSVDGIFLSHAKYFARGWIIEERLRE